MNRPLFYLVQRVKYEPTHRALPAVFGYGQVGDYKLDYMGSAEFEWGAIPDALGRLIAANQSGRLSTLRYKQVGRPDVVLAYESDVSPLASWLHWIEQDDVRGNEPPYEFAERYLRCAPRRQRPTIVWWSLTDNVLWSFEDDKHDDGLNHLERFLAQLPQAIRVRG